MSGLLLANADLLLLSVIIPFLLMGFFTLIRKMYGNSVTALPDTLIFLCVVDFYFALTPDPWTGLVHPLVKDFFPKLAFALGLVAAIVFLFTLSVEKKLIRSWVRNTFPSVVQLMPREIRNQKFPFISIAASWLLIASLFALNALQFTGK